MKYAYPKIIVDLQDRFSASVLEFEDKKRELKEGELAMVEVADDTPKTFSWKKDI